jgi:3-hydroxyisobutyrate dehydrogenase-like beta-hydroxyacid dehydrogenase
MSKQRIGYIGVGLRGHGVARNILQKGYPMTIMGHRNRGPWTTLIALGAQEAKRRPPSPRCPMSCF